VEFTRIYDQVGAYALMSKAKARKLYEFVLREKPRCVFEMGAHRGGSALIMAAALQELGTGTVTTFDFQDIHGLAPNIESLINRSHLHKFISVVCSDWCYEWELGKLLESRRTPRNRIIPFVDFAYIDGGHYWTSTGFTFYLITKLLRPGGWLLLDDLDWMIEKHESTGNSYARRISTEAKRRPMVRMVFDLLVRTSNSYHNCRIAANGSWGWAQKKDGPGNPPTPKRGSGNHQHRTARRTLSERC
jgi:predicted O-methyltransferase YrrM